MTTFAHSQKKESLFFDYCQFLLASIMNWTQTYFADHIEEFGIVTCLYVNPKTREYWIIDCRK